MLKITIYQDKNNFSIIDIIKYLSHFQNIKCIWFNFFFENKKGAKP